jgi:hypothetical protein
MLSLSPLRTAGVRFHIVTAAPRAPGCPPRGVVSTSVKQYRTTLPRDPPYEEEPLAVRWHNRQYR